MGLLGLLAGLLLATVTLLIESALRRIPLKTLLGGFIGLLLGEMVANLISNVFLSNLLTNKTSPFPFTAALRDLRVHGHPDRSEERRGPDALGMEGFSKNPPTPKMQKSWTPASSLTAASLTLQRPDSWRDRCSSRSSSSASFSTLPTPPILSSGRGQKGLEVLHHVQKQAGIVVKIVDKDYPLVKEVDSKLVELAKEVRGKIITMIPTSTRWHNSRDRRVEH